MRSRPRLRALRYSAIAALLGLVGGSAILLGFGAVALDSEFEWLVRELAVVVLPLPLTSIVVALLLRRWILNPRGLEGTLLAGCAAYFVGAYVHCGALLCVGVVASGGETFEVGWILDLEGLLDALTGIFNLAALGAPIGVPVCTLLVFALRVLSGVTPDPPRPGRPTDANSPEPPACDSRSREAPR